jgi:hypothetical protein
VAILGWSSMPGSHELALMGVPPGAEQLGRIGWVGVVARTFRKMGELAVQEAADGASGSLLVLSALLTLPWVGKLQGQA